ncbi:MAG: HAMP domain-containing histidine kinase, partial [Romboutsia sp.]|nr:HAMP domain-containing histidine kinase [Romboutsia sp.]
HELKTPLNLIHASNQLMDSVYSKQLKENNNLDILNDVKIIKKQVNILSTLIDNIIELSKLHHNSHEIKKDNYNIVEILDEIVEQFNKFIEKDNINIIFDPDEEEKIVNIDADDIEKVIIILLSLVTRYSNNNSCINFKVKTKKDFIIINIENSSGYNYDNYLIDSEKSVLDMGVKLAKEIIGLYDGKLNISEEDKSIYVAVKIKNICKTKNYRIRVRNNNEEFIHSQYKKMCNF